MQIVTDIAALRAALARARRASASIALVPTMGNLHAGHYALVEQARQHATLVVASIFVNPTQFGPNEDYGSYPRTLEADAAGLVRVGADLLFAPTVADMYPAGTRVDTHVDMPVLANILCGAFRPGHFSGVATVVAKLFNLVQPDVAVFGAKDYQQLMVIRHLVRDLSFPIEIVGAPIVRDADGLAMSSRNQYLTPDERRRAPLIQATLLEMARRARAGEERGAIETDAARALDAQGFRVDYCAIRRSDDLSEPSGDLDRGCIALAAAWLGRARLIDNVLI